MQTGVLLALGLIAASCGGNPPASAPVGPAAAVAPRVWPGGLDPSAGVDSPVLRALLADSWEDGLERSPFYATKLGDRRYDDRLPDLSVTGYEEARASRDAFLARARGIEPAGLTARDRVTLGIYLADLDASVAADVCHGELWSESAYSSSLSYLEIFPDRHLASGASAASYLARVRGVAAEVDHVTARLRAGASSGWVASAETLRRFVERIDGQLKTAASAWPYARGPREATALAEAERARLTADVDAEVVATVMPAYQRLRDAIVADVLPKARTDEGLTGLRDGAACYAATIVAYTGLALSPAALHQSGLDELTRIEAEIVGLGGKRWGVHTMAEVRARLATDQAMYFTTEAEIVAAAETAVARATEGVKPVFARLSTLPLEVTPFPLEEQVAGGLASYSDPSPDGKVPGRFYLQTTPPERQGRWTMEVLAFHEAIPGHHLQISRALELGELPAFRRTSGNTAYVEGWGLYTERLCRELGLYSDDVAWLGALGFDAWRATRLVVDTGLHSMGWTRAQAEAFMRDHTLETPELIRSEVERYLAWPGQALAYKVGQRELLRLRDHAKAKLGDRFSLAAFHEVVLGQGAVPLPVLGELVEAWIAGGGAGAK